MRAPSSGTRLQASRARSAGWSLTPSYVAATACRALRSPDVDHAVDRLRAQVWAVAEHDHRSLCLGRQRLETAAKRRAGTALPLRAADRPALEVSSSCAPSTTTTLVHGALPNAFQNRLEEQPLLRRADRLDARAASTTAQASPACGHG